MSQARRARVCGAKILLLDWVPVGVCVRHELFPELDPHPLLSCQPYSFVAQSGILTMHRRKMIQYIP